MNSLLHLLAESAATSTEATSSGSSSGSSSLTNLLKNPALYIVLGVIVLLIIAFWLVRRYVTAKDNASTVITKHGEIVAVVGKQEGEVAKMFAAPFITKIGSPIQRKGNLFSSDQLLINDGPDKLYRVSFSLGYDVVDVKAYFHAPTDFLKNELNDSLRSYAYQGNADKILRTYVEEEANLVALLNKAYEGKGVNVTSFKINSIAPVSAK